MSLGTHPRWRERIVRRMGEIAAKRRANTANGFDLDRLARMRSVLARLERRASRVRETGCQGCEGTGRVRSGMVLEGVAMYGACPACRGTGSAGPSGSRPVLREG